MLELRAGRVTVEVHFLFLAMLTLCFLLDESGIAWLGLLAGLLHEAGHLAAVLLCGGAPGRLAFEMTGIRMEEPRGGFSPGKEAAVLAAGSAVNLLLAAGSLAAGWEAFAAGNLLLGLLNLAPVRGLDGGKLLVLLLSRRLDLYKSERILFFIQIVINLVLTFFCAACFWQRRGNPTLGVLCVYLWASACGEAGVPARRRTSRRGARP